MAGKLFLGGGGEEHTYSEVGGEFFRGVKRVLYIPLAWPNGDYQSCLKWFQSISNKFGKRKIEMMVDPLKHLNFMDYGGIFIGGGNTFKLLRGLKEGRLEKRLLDYYQNGGKIFGGSAGTLIFGYDINTAKICKEKDRNLVRLKDTRGMNVLNGCDFQVHYIDSQLKQQRDYSIKTKRRRVAIPEGTALLVGPGRCEVIGKNPVYLISGREIIKYSPGEKLGV